MSHRCYMCNRTDDPAVALSPFDVFKGSYSEVRGDPTKEICSDCNHAYLSSLMEMDVPKSRTHQIVETEDSYEVTYDPDVDDYSDDYEDFDYTNYDIYDDERDEEESGDIKW